VLDLRTVLPQQDGLLAQLLSSPALTASRTAPPLREA
jgi:hypothetical protein